ncbi:MAG TPA: HNH endonuclease [Candidatus Eisenbacteria bacterium]|jgi:hypothetical protein
MNRAGILQLLEQFPERHLSALAWFEQHAGQEVAWPKPLPDGTLLAAKAKGIYKPAWSKYALSVRQSLGGPYPDREIEMRPDGGWRLEYFQEDLDPGRRDSQFTNVGLMECWKDVVPVGVLVQSVARPGPRYRVYGLALVTGWDGGYFYLEGLARGDRGWSLKVVPTATTRADLLAEDFEPTSLEDRRRETNRMIVLRQGQQGFRRALLLAYQGRCAITGCDGVQALEAAHIVPYRGLVTNHPTNGLLLRADIHNLFDLGLLAIDPANLKVLWSSELDGTSYVPVLRGATVRRPVDSGLAPSQAALRIHREWACL